jgi:hypothetical protein
LGLFSSGSNGDGTVVVIFGFLLGSSNLGLGFGLNSKLFGGFDSSFFFFLLFEC